MGLFGPPDVRKMEAKKRVRGLIKALGYQKNARILYVKDVRIRVEAAQALGRIRDARAVGPLVAAIDPNCRDEERAAFLGALVQIGAPAAQPLVTAMMSCDSWDQRPARGNWVNWDAIKALAQIGAPAGESLIAVLKHSDSYVRRDAAEALGEIKDTRAVESLVAALRDSEAGVGGAAARALIQIGAPVGASLIAALKDSTARFWAADVLDNIGWPQDPGAQAWHAVRLKEWARAIALGSAAVEPLIAALEDSKVAEAAAKALGEIGDVRAVEPLASSLGHSEFTVRAAVAESLAVLYRSNRLATDQKQRILSFRGKIEADHNDIPGQAHRDKTAHVDEYVKLGPDDHDSSCSSHHDYGHTDDPGKVHVDQRITVDFPL